jgi:hypothetical protein
MATLTVRLSTAMGQSETVRNQDNFNQSLPPWIKPNESLVSRGDGWEIRPLPGKML